MSRAKTTDTTSRRRFLAGTAAAAALAGAPALSAEPPVDPALDAIARHRQAFADLLAAITATDNTDPHTDARSDAEDRQTEACSHETDMAWELAGTTPTTTAGIAAVLEYVNRYETAGELWPNVHDCTGPRSWHFKLRQTMARAAAKLSGAAGFEQADARDVQLVEHLGTVN
ncbi:twin-arginine translocation signal domain-containing protein [Bradyrhizobium sp. 26S5]|uniref:twin-arginine translocation signal domain-containing protein n=1 Tax=Bradyrhizobium sp. 26S5 TaxID=3139729 RepID=UPI0030CEAB7C